MFLDVGMCYLLNLAFLITWYSRIAEIELGRAGEWAGQMCFVCRSSFCLSG